MADSSSFSHVGHRSVANRHLCSTSSIRLPFSSMPPIGRHLPFSSMPPMGRHLPLFVWQRRRYLAFVGSRRRLLASYWKMLFTSDQSGACASCTKQTFSTKKTNHIYLHFTPIS